MRRIVWLVLAISILFRGVGHAETRLVDLADRSSSRANLQALLLEEKVIHRTRLGSVAAGPLRRAGAADSSARDGP